MMWAITAGTVDVVVFYTVRGRLLCDLAFVVINMLCWSGAMAYRVVWAESIRELRNGF